MAQLTGCMNSATKTGFCTKKRTTSAATPALIWTSMDLCGTKAVTSSFRTIPTSTDLSMTCSDERRTTSIRESWIVKGDSWIPYPFQNNLRYLPKPQQVSCLLGAAKAAANGKSGDATNFRDWILSTFGEGIAEEFMFPYNSKVWTTPLDQMSRSWIAERVATVDFRRLLENVLYDRDDAGWGPNSKFRFPLYGGTGEIYRRMVKRFPDKIKTSKKLMAVDDRQRRVVFRRWERR